MTIFTLIAIIIGGLAAIFLIFAYLQPAKWEVRETVIIDAPQAEVFRYLAELKNWEKWTIWNKDTDERYQFEYEGPEFGVGAIQKWNSKGRKGQMKITDMNQPTKLRYVLNMGRGKMEMEGELLLRNADQGTEVTWRSYGDNKYNPGGRVMMKMFMPYMRKDFQKGLQRLQEVFAVRSE